MAQDFFVVSSALFLNDGSTDNGPQMVMQWQHPFIRLINQKNSGVSIARNTGIKAAKGNIIAFLDADDEWMKICYTDKKNKQVTKLLRIEAIDEIEIEE